MCVGSAIHLHLIKEIAALAKIKIELIAVPFSKNTAAAMTAASIRSISDEVLIFCPSDHYIPKNNEYLESLVLVTEKSFFQQPVKNRPLQDVFCMFF